MMDRATVALSGGVYPVSAVLARDEIMLCIKFGEHGKASTLWTFEGPRAMSPLVNIEWPW